MKMIKREGGICVVVRMKGKRERKKGSKCLYVAKDPLSSRTSLFCLSPPPPPTNTPSSLPLGLPLQCFPLANITQVLTMLEAFEILTTSGVVLWSKSYAPVGAHVINSLINDVFIEEKMVPQAATATGVSPVFKKEKYTLKWKRVKEFNLIFVVCLVLSHATGVTQKSSPFSHLGCLPIIASPRLDR